MPSPKNRSTTSTRASTPPHRSPNPGAAAAPTAGPSEITTLLPPSSSSSTASPASSPTAVNSFNRSHARKASTGGRSVSGRSTAGSVRNYGATGGKVVGSQPGPVEQAPRVSKLGQRRILTTWPLQITFSLLTMFTFLSLVLTLILFLNTAIDLSGISLPYSGFSEFWIAAVGSWIGLGGVFFFSHPSYLFFLTTLLTLLLLLPLLLLTLLSPPLAHLHHPLLLVPASITTMCLLFTLLANYLVRRARYKESQRIVRMLTDAAARERGAGEEGTARALVGVQGGLWGRVVGFFSAVVGLIAGLGGLIIVTLLLIDMSITAYDDSLPLPSHSSQLISIRPPGSSWPITIHLACVPPKSNSSSTSSLPTVVYESSSGIPGSLALLDVALPPAGIDEDFAYPGRWLLEMQQSGSVGTVCLWDRPGYGFSDLLPGADLAKVSETLYLALKSSGHLASKTQLILVGEGYGGLLTRVFASNHAKHVAGLVHIEAQTAHTYFSENPNGRGIISLTTHRLATRLLPSLLTPLSLVRLPSALLRRSSSLSRILANTLPPTTEYLSEPLQKARLQETFSSHSHTSGSFRALLESGVHYPSRLPAVVVSSERHMAEDPEWAEGQRGLAEEVTAPEGLLEWVKVKSKRDKAKNGREGVCEDPKGREECERAVKRVIKGK